MEPAHAGEEGFLWDARHVDRGCHLVFGLQLHSGGEGSPMIRRNEAAIRWFGSWLGRVTWRLRVARWFVAARGHL